MSYIYFFNNFKFTGGTYRFLISLYFLKDYELYLPKNIKLRLLSHINFIEEEIRNEVEEIIRSSEMLPSYPQDKIHQIFYLKNLSKFFREPVYYPSENYLFTKFANIKKLQLLQSTPVIGAYLLKEKISIGNLVKNTFLTKGKKQGTIHSFYQLSKISTYNNHIFLSVSPSIKYELKRMGVKCKILSLFPGNAVFHKYRKMEENKEYDIAFVGAPSFEKGFFDFIKVVNRLKNNRIKILIISERDTARKYMQTLNLDKKRVEIWDYLPKTKLYNKIASSKILINLSRIESFSLITLEALSVGTPVIAYDIPAIRFNYKTPSVIKMPLGKTKLIADTIKYLLNNPDVLENLSKEGIKYSKKFNWKVVFKNEENLIKKIIDLI